VGDGMDMSTPVTRRELREELSNLEQRLEQRLAQMATKADLEIWGGALLAELARHAKAIQESLATQISAMDDKYADLPGRVNRLESTVFAPKRR
jgi:hypothetical protein